MRQSIIAILITTVVTICGGTFDKNNGYLPEEENTTCAEIVETSVVIAETVTYNCDVPTKEEITTDNLIEATTKNEANTSTPEATTGIETVTTAPETTTRKEPVTTAPETTTKSDDIQNMSYARQVVELVNKERKKAGLNPLTVDTKIENAALVRAKEIEKSFSHTRPDGRSFSTVLSENGVSFRGAGENIAWGQSNPEAVMNAWMNSSGHRANILNANFTKIGVGYYVGANGRKYWTQLFTY